MILRVSQMLRWVLPVVVTLLFFWQTLGIWFRADDFAWLGLRLSIHRPSDLLEALFAPMAQGTVRFLSERTFFLVFEKLFGLNPLPFRIAILAAQSVSGILLATVTRRLTGSAVTGAIAVIFWVLQVGLTDAMGWISSANQIFCGLFILAAFLAFIDRRMIWCWIIFVLGFGTLETMVVFPALLLVYVLIFDRERIKQTLPFWIPSLIFLWLRLGVFGKISNDPAYAMHFAPKDLWNTLSVYIDLSIGWWIVIPVALLIAWKTFVQDYVPVFGLAWLLILIAPILPLKNHVLLYYLAVPGMALAFLLAFLVEDLWKRNALGGLAAMALTISLVLTQWKHTRWTLDWHRDRSAAARQLIQGVASAHSAYPDKTIFLARISNELFWQALADDPFRLTGTPRPFLAPGAEKGIDSHQEWGGIKGWMIPLPATKQLFRQGKALVYEPAKTRLNDVTPQWAKQVAQLPEGFASVVELGDEAYIRHLADGWYQPENHARWMAKKAAVMLSTPEDATQIVVKGYLSSALLNTDAVELKVLADDQTLGMQKLQTPDTPFELSYVLPRELRGKPEVRVQLESNRTITVPGDERVLSFIISSIQAQ